MDENIQESDAAIDHWLDEEVLIQAVLSEDGSVGRRQKFSEMLAEVGPILKCQDKDASCQLLLEKHQAFAVDEGERGNID